MMSVSKISSGNAGGISNYFERTAGQADYYQKGGEPPGMWYGKGAESLGLKGEVQAGELHKAMQGFHPKTDEPLTKNAGSESRAAGWDCTFSAPKSVSAEWAVAPREIQKEIQSCHDRAVEKAMNYVEREAVHARRGHAGEIKENVQGIAAAIYQHSTNRNGDPQLHTHAVVQNFAQRQDGKMGNIDLDTRHKMAAGALYRAELAENLRQKGFQIERDGDSFKIAGVPDKLSQEWSSRHAEIEKHMQETGAVGYEASKKASLQTRQAKGEINRQESMKEWRETAARHEFTPDKAAELKGHIPGMQGPGPVDHEILEKLTEKNSTFSRTQLLHEVAKVAQGSMGADAAERHVKDMLEKHPDIVPMQKDGEIRYTTKEMLSIEKNMVDKALAMQKNESHKVSPEIVSKAIEGKGLSREQEDAVRHLTEKTGGIAAVEGWAGTGKSYMMNQAREAWEKAGFEVRGAALPGKAGEELERSSGIQSQTIHSLIHELETGKTKLDEKTVMVVDEAGMVGSRQMETLVRECEKAGAKLALVGDTAQIQAIDAGAAFRAVTERTGKVEMSEVRRQHHQEDREMAKAFREGRSADALKNLDERGKLHAEKDQDAAGRKAVEGLVRDLQHGKDSVAYAATRKEVREMNQMARDMLKEKGMLPEKGENVVTPKGMREFAPGDRVVFNKTDKELGVKNGTQGQIKSVDPATKTMRVDLQNGKVKEFNYEKHTNLDHGYAQTVHKGQGATHDTAHVKAGELSNKEWMYVAATRARESTEVYTSRDMVQKEDGKKSDLEKATGRSQGKDTSMDYNRVDQKREPDRGEEKRDDRYLPENMKGEVKEEGKEPDRTSQPERAEPENAEISKGESFSSEEVRKTDENDGKKPESEAEYHQNKAELRESDQKSGQEHQKPSSEAESDHRTAEQPAPEGKNQVEKQAEEVAEPQQSGPESRETDSKSGQKPQETSREAKSDGHSIEKPALEEKTSEEKEDDKVAEEVAETSSADQEREAVNAEPVKGHEGMQQQPGNPDQAREQAWAEIEAQVAEPQSLESEPQREPDSEKPDDRYENLNEADFPEEANRYSEDFGMDEAAESEHGQEHESEVEKAETERQKEHSRSL